MRHQCDQKETCHSRPLQKLGRLRFDHSDPTLPGGQYQQLLLELRSRGQYCLLFQWYHLHQNRQPASTYTKVISLNFGIRRFPAFCCQEWQHLSDGRFSVIHSAKVYREEGLSNGIQTGLPGSAREWFEVLGNGSFTESRLWDCWEMFR